MPGLSPETMRCLRCPRCGGELRDGAGSFRCVGCAASYPVADGIPVLIADEKSVFRTADFVAGKRTTFKEMGRVEALARRLVPQISRNVAARDNYRRLRELLAREAGRPKARVLVIGGGIAGEGFEEMLAADGIELVETDVSFGPRTGLICDAHDLPFATGTFDAAISQAVLEHVLDPARCVAEIRRVLAPRGLVYAETPFMQQVHGGRYDFTRFTHLGHRRLFRDFEELSSGAAGGPGMSLAWAWQYFLLSFFRSRRLRMAVYGVARLSSFWLTWFDGFLAAKPGGLDAASGVFFLGRKSDVPLDDRALLAAYRGAN